MNGIQLEIACFDPASALIAAGSGAHRIELCENIELGGTSPSYSMFTGLKKKVNVPVFVMIRPRGGDFSYLESEFLNMKQQIAGFAALGADGFVFGVLDNDQIDIKRNAELVSYAAGLPCTFHRAFDHCADPGKSLEAVIGCGFKRILCSGARTNVMDGIHQLKALNKQASGRIIIMPGGGLRSSNIAEVMRITGCLEFHTSAITSGSNIADKNEIKRILAHFSS